MRKIIAILFVSISFISFAQQEEESELRENKNDNELKMNMTNLIIFKFVDIAYERILNDEASIGASLLLNADQGNDGEFTEYRKFSFTPYYRHFFSNKYAKGFFVEAFTMLHSGEEEIFNFTDDGIFDNDYTYEDYTDLAIGISAGGKFVTKRGFVAEIYLGLGRDLLGNSDLEVVGRGGISLGYRF